MKTKLSNIRMIIREELERPTVDPAAIIYCDMDGVLVDFVAGAIGLAAQIISGEVGQGWVGQSKSMRRALKDIRAEYNDDWQPTTSKELDLPAVRSLMFAAISFAPGKFFSELKPLPDGLSTLWPYITSTGHDVALLTAPVGGRTKGDLDTGMSAGKGKELWADSWLRPSPSEVIISPAKSKLDSAVSGNVANILIDDKASTVKAWNDATEAAGFGRGFGILHVTGGSSQTVQQLQALGV